MIEFVRTPCGTYSLLCRLLAVLDLLSYRSTVETLHVHVRRLQPPRGSDDLRCWIIDRWKEKEELLEQFERTGEFPGQEVDVPLPRWQGGVGLLFANLFFTVFLFPVLFPYFLTAAVLYFAVPSLFLAFFVMWR